jgi:hypothetical protein
MLAGMSFLLPEPAHLFAVADRIGDHASASRHRAAHLGAAVSAAGWHGIAADAFHAQAHSALATLRSSAGRLDAAADMLRRHAARVRAVSDDIERATLDGLRLSGDVFTAPGRLFADGRDLVFDGAGLAADALSLVGLG